MEMTAVQKQNAIKTLREIKTRLLKDRQSLVDLMISAREESATRDVHYIQIANDNLEGATHNIDRFLESQTAQHWEQTR